jgi:hypothetical protein
MWGWNRENSAKCEGESVRIWALAENCKFTLTFWTSPGLRSHLTSIHAFASHTLAVLHKCLMQYSPCFFFADALHGIIIISAWKILFAASVWGWNRDNAAKCEGEIVTMRPNVRVKAWQFWALAANCILTLTFGALRGTNICGQCVMVKLWQCGRLWWWKSDNFELLP